MDSAKDSGNSENSLNMQKQYEKNVVEKSDDAYSLSIKVQTTLNHILSCFLPQYQRQNFFFFRACGEKGISREMDFYGQRKISSNCGEKPKVSNLFLLFNPFTPNSALWHYKTHCFLKSCNFLNRANFALSISCEHWLESSSNCVTQ